MAVAPLVVKIGGEVAAGEGLLTLGRDVAALVTRGERVVVVHGGGPQASDLSRRLGIEIHQVAGRRITDAATLDVMKMALAGKVNVDVCAALLGAGARPVGLHGASALAVAARRRPPRVVTGGGLDPIDFGHVGDVTGFNIPLLELLWGAGYVPVLACLGADEHGAVYNINADIVGNQLAAAVKGRLFLITSTPGVLRDLDDESTRLPHLTGAQARRAIADGIVTGGMIPKIEEALAVLAGGAAAIHIVGRLGAGELVRAVDEPGAIGTTLVA